MACIKFYPVSNQEGYHRDSNSALRLFRCNPPKSGIDALKGAKIKYGEHVYTIDNAQVSESSDPALRGVLCFASRQLMEGE